MISRLRCHRSRGCSKRTRRVVQKRNGYVLCGVFLLLILYLQNKYVAFGLSLHGSTSIPHLHDGKSSRKLVTHGLKGGRDYKVPASWNRYESPWFKTPETKLLSPIESNFRYLYSPIRLMSSDGVGHSLGAVNAEYNAALRLNLTYVHRVGYYSSLSSKDRMAVEDFFGWGDHVVQRKYVQMEGCEPRDKVWPNESRVFECHYCGGPKEEGKMEIKKVVNLPADISPVCAKERASCAVTERQFLAIHHQSYTIFQVPLNDCKAPPTDSNFIHTKSIFYHNYWNRHGRLPWSKEARRNFQKTNITFDPSYLNIAMHIRRGDFLKSETRKKRTVTNDDVFSNVFAKTVGVISRVGGVFASMPVALHIYSEGKLLRDRVSSTHAMEMQDKNYYDSQGQQRDENWWRNLLSESFDKNSAKAGPAALQKVRIHFHISEDTLKSLHHMIAADVFIGSASGLSGNLVWSMSRGVVVIPSQGPINNERGKKGEICCSVPFENESGRFREDLFEMYWSAYTAGNEDSAHQSRINALAKPPRQREKEVRAPSQIKAIFDYSRWFAGTSKDKDTSTHDRN